MDVNKETINLDLSIVTISACALALRNMARTSSDEQISKKMIQAQKELNDQIEAAYYAQVSIKNIKLMGE